MSTVADVEAQVRASSVPYVLELLGERWTFPLLGALLVSPRRFEDLVESLGVPRSTLASRLSHLVERGLVERREYEQRPPRSVYALTERGRLAHPLVLLARDFDRRFEDRHDLPPLVHASCGAPLEVSLVCAACEAPVRATEVELGPASGPAEASLGPLPVRRSRGVAPNEGDAGPRSATDVLGDRWASLVVAVVFFGVRRYGEIESLIGIAPNILARKLAWLVERGLLERRAYQSSPERHDYRLTAKGKELFPLVLALADYGDHVLRPRHEASMHLRHLPCGRPLRTELRCTACRTPVEIEAVRAPDEGPPRPPALAGPKAVPTSRP